MVYAINIREDVVFVFPLDLVKAEATMGSISCIKHPRYNGKTSPVLSCKTCCSLFIHNIKKTREEEQKTVETAKDAASATTQNQLAKAESNT